MSIGLQRQLEKEWPLLLANIPQLPVLFSLAAFLHLLNIPLTFLDSAFILYYISASFSCFAPSLHCLLVSCTSMIPYYLQGSKCHLQCAASAAIRIAVSLAANPLMLISLPLALSSLPWFLSFTILSLNPLTALIHSANSFSFYPLSRPKNKSFAFFPHMDWT